MNCQICLERYNTVNRIPKNLGCGHTFCDRCLKKLASGYDIECPKCRQKSKNNLPICYALYDYLILEDKADLDEPCKIHEYEKLQFYCNKDKCNICVLCLSSVHQGHYVSSIKDKILSDENENVLIKWNTYFTFKKEEYLTKREKLSNLLHNFEKQKSQLSKKIVNNYDKLIENFNKSKVELIREMDDLYFSELYEMQKIKNKIDEALTEISQFTREAEELYLTLPEMSNRSVLSINMDRFTTSDNAFTKRIESLIQEKTKIKFKTIKWSDDVIFKQKDVLLDTILSEESKLKNHILLFGDFKDKIILNYDVSNHKWTKMESTYSNEFEFLDYSCITQYKNDLLLITGGCIYSNYRNTASKSTFLAKVITKDQLTFTEFKPLLSERFSHGSQVVKGVPYVFGGHNGFHTLNTLESYDEKEGRWISCNEMLVEREIFAHCVVKQRYIYVFGGFNDTHLDSIEKYDCQTDKWKLLCVKMMKSLQNSTAVTISDEQIALIGGYNGTMHRSIDILNLSTLTWTSLEKMKVPRRRSHCYKIEDKIIIVGGEGTEVDLHMPEIFDIKSQNMSFTEPCDLIMAKSMNFWASALIQ